MKSSIFRPIQLVLLGAITLILIALLVTSWLTWREQVRLAHAGTVLGETLAFHAQHQLLERQMLATREAGSASDRARLIRQIDALAALCSERDIATLDLLTKLKRLAASEPRGSGQTSAAIHLLHEISQSEARFEARVIADLRRESSTQMQYELAAPIALLAIAIVAIPIARRRVLKPLEDFGRQMTGLAEGDFSPTPSTEISENTLPLHRNFLKLAMRLQELEREQRERAESLEEEVRTATTALLEQQQSLARAERLAVAGELAASVAHEIRNPLAGIQMSLVNLRHELSEPALIERIDLVVAEVERMARLVGEIVNAARHDPEPSVVVNVAELVDELLALTRYQLPPGTRLESHVALDLRARLPKERLRQALLNLVLNSTTAIGDTPGQIEIEIDQENSDLRIQVSDNGPGFPDDLILGGVRPFHSTRTHGAGLGLAMVRRFVREAEGSMRLENRTGPGDQPGARVTLLLPSTIENG